MNPITEIVEAGESERTAFAPPRAALETLGKTVCGLLNQQGGRVLWGVDEHGVARGVVNAKEKASELNTLLMESLAPRRPLLSVSVEELNGQSLILIEIPAGADKPYSFERKIWVRVGSTNLRASEDQSAEMVEQSAARQSRWGRELAPGFSLADCDERELTETQADLAAVGRFGTELPRDHEALLRRLYLLNSARPTNAAVVLFARDPLAWAPNLAVRIVSFLQGRSDRELHEQTLEGPAIRVLKQAVTILQQQTGFTARFQADRLEREDRPAYALYALREGLVNAIVHRDYEAMGGQVRVEIYPEHLVIQNPGRLPDGWTEEDIVGKEESNPTNPDLARVFYLRGLMERLGLGGRKLVEACRAIKAKPPVWKAAQGSVSLILYRAPRTEAAGHLLQGRAVFLVSLAAGAEMKAEEYAERAGVSIRQARRDLGELEEAGVVERQGRGPATVYRRKAGKRS